MGDRRGNRFYRLLLRLFPREFRDERGDEMERLFAAMRDRRLGEGGPVGAAFWIRLTADTVTHALVERIGGRRRTAGEDVGAGLIDVRQAGRSLRRRPGYAAMVVVMMAVGIGGSAGMFRVFNGLFLRPLPFDDPGRLVDLDETAPRWNLDYTGLSYRDLVLWREGNRTFDAMGAISVTGANLAHADGAERIDVVRATHDVDDVLRLEPVVGRFFTDDEDRPDGAFVALLSHGYWERRYAGDHGVIGSTLLLDGIDHEVVGVLPPEAGFVADADVWIPLKEDPEGGTGWYLDGIGRLLPDVTPEAALSDLARIHRAAAEEREENAITSPTVGSLTDRYLGEYRLGSWVLLGAVGLVLVIACANIAALTLARSLERDREIAVRSALGASRRRVVVQLLTESLVLAGVGGALGLALGIWGSGAALRTLTDQFPRWVTFESDWRVLLFAALLSGGSAVAFGLVPALQAAGVDGGLLTRASDRSTAGRTKRRVMGLLVAGEVALATVLLVMAGASVQDLVRLQGIDPGYRTEGILTYRLTLPDAVYPDRAAWQDFLDRHLEGLEAVPGVQGATAASTLPLSGHWGWFYEAEGAPERGPDDPNPVVLTRSVTPGYFDVMDVSLVAGRGLQEADGRESGSLAVVVNETFAREFFPGEPRPVGRRIRTGPQSDWLTIVGVSRDVKHYGVDEDMRPGVYQPLTQVPLQRFMVAVRTTGEPTALVAPVRESLRALDPTLPMADVRTMAERTDESLWARRAQSWLFASFSGVALLLAVAGLYGVIAYSVRQRIHEIGIRMALGARRGRVLGEVVQQGMTLVGTGLVVGLVGAVAVGRLAGELFVTSGGGGLPYVAASVLLLLVAATANALPARRAAALDPSVALRNE